MKVSKQSWHYRIVKHVKGYEGPSTNLCAYFWEVVFVTLVLPAAGLGMTALLLLPFWWWVDPELLPVAVIFGIVDIALLILIWKNYRENLRRQGRLPPKAVNKGPSLLTSWWRARKEKICPIIEFE